MASTNVCRICTKPNNVLLDIFGENRLAAKISRCFTVRIRRKDNITTKICEPCYMLTMATYTKQLQIRQNNTELWKQYTPIAGSKPETKKRKLELKHNKIHASVKKLKRDYPNIKIPKNIQNSNLLPHVICDKVIEIERQSKKLRDPIPNGISNSRTTDDASALTNFGTNDNSSASSTTGANVFELEPSLTEYSLGNDVRSFQSPVSTQMDLDDDGLSVASSNYQHLIRPNAIVLLEKLDYLNTTGMTSLLNDSTCNMMTLNRPKHQRINVLPDLVLDTTNKGMPPRNLKKELVNIEYVPLAELVDDLNDFNRRV